MSDRMKLEKKAHVVIIFTIVWPCLRDRWKVHHCLWALWEYLTKGWPIMPRYE